MPTKKTLHLVCNAHLDPVWLWNREDGIAAAVSTFRAAVELCEQFDELIFCHNESLLYQWIETLEPDLFKKIRRLVRAGKWHIMGGWYLQPDCNMPSGESLVRQILLGRRYFKEKFDREPTTAVNFDTFGHSRGLVQILAKSGFKSYLFMRPHASLCPLPEDQFRWIGFEGSEVVATRVKEYNSNLGNAHLKIRKWLEENADIECGIVLWGVGNHGGGPSRIDLKRIRQIISETDHCEIRHSTPERYFEELCDARPDLPVYEGSLNHILTGCYTSMIRIKQKHRQLENELYRAEKMAVAAFANKVMAYPREELNEALKALLFSEFHDILPGSAIQEVEESSLHTLDHGLEIVSNLTFRTFVAMSSGEPEAKEGEIPVLIYNPHPFPIKGGVECELYLGQINWDKSKYILPKVYHKGRPVPCQVEKEQGNFPVDWGKRMIIQADLTPGKMTRYDCRFEELPRKPPVALKPHNGVIHFKTEQIEVIINTRTGLIDRYRVDGIDYMGKNAFRPVVIEDHANSWGGSTLRFDEEVGHFKLMNRKDGSLFSGQQKTIPSVRIIEDGDVRTIVEAVFGYGDSAICQQYKLPKQGTEIEIETRVYWHEKDRMLKLYVPVSWKGGRLIGQVVYGREDLSTNGNEAVAQKWVAAVCDEKNTTLTSINDGTYGVSFGKRTMRLNLLRSPAYACTEIQPAIRDRHVPRIDQGERQFRFWLNGGKADELLKEIDTRALAKNEKPFALSFFPAGTGKKPKPFLKLSNPVIQVSAVKKAEDGDDIIIRFFEPTGRRRTTTVALEGVPLKFKVHLEGFEVKTYRVNINKRNVSEVDLLERSIKVST